MSNLTNQFFDITRLPISEGLLIFPISMSRISNSQMGSKYFKIIESFNVKINRATIGVSFIYTDALYSKYSFSSISSKNKYIDLMLSHKNLFMKTLRKNSTYVESAFSFTTWSQLILETTNFLDLFSKIQKLYHLDKDFNNYVAEDIKRSKKTLTKNNIDFILEEILMVYLLINEEIYIHNKFISGRDKWRLLCYLGKPNKSMIYFIQKNILKLTCANIYNSSFYDLSEKKLYNFDNFDL
ncbi:MAG: hypothetical protein HRU03_00130 [Nanoarchaeales archaeon]|nr:hypothetical protein [Nanoarchaeales archaeon]